MSRSTFCLHPARTCLSKNAVRQSLHSPKQARPSRKLVSSRASVVLLRMVRGAGHEPIGSTTGRGR